MEHKHARTACPAQQPSLKGSAEVKGQPLMMLCSSAEFFRTVCFAVDEGRSTGIFTITFSTKMQLLSESPSTVLTRAFTVKSPSGAQMERSWDRCLLMHYRIGWHPLQSLGINHNVHGFIFMAWASSLRGPLCVDKIAEHLFLNLKPCNSLTRELL